MSYVVSSDFSPFATCGCWKEGKTAAGDLMVPNSHDSVVVDNDGYFTLKRKVRFRGWTEIVERDTRTVTGLVESESCADENWVFRPRASETASARYQQWLGWYLGDKDCLLWKKGSQFRWRVCVERGWTTAVDEVTV